MVDYKILIAEKVSLKELISSLGQHIKKNRVDCPTCGGNDAYLNPKTGYNTVKCFNCAEHFNIFDWTMASLGVTFKEAFNYLLDFAGVKINFHDYDKMISEMKFKKIEKRKNDNLLYQSESNLVNLNRLLDEAEEQGLHSDVTEEMAINYRCAVMKHRKLKKKLGDNK